MPKDKKSRKTSKKRNNIHKFSPFSEQINSISVSSLQRYHHVAPDHRGLPITADCLLDQPSHLQSGIEEQYLECQTQAFTVLMEQLRPYIGSYKEVVLHQRYIFTKLSDCVRVSDDFTLISVLKLVSDFCRDLQTDFYAYFFDLIDVLGSKLKTILTSKCLVEIFSCLTKAIKILLKTFDPGDMKRFLASLSLFMESKKLIEVKFASGAFAFICKKLLSVEAVTDILYQTIYAKVVNGYHLVVIEMVEGVGVEFNPLITSFVDSLVKKLPHKKCAASLLKLTIRSILEVVVKNEHLKTSGDGLESVWKCIKENLLSANTSNVARFSVLHELIEFQDGYFAMKHDLGGEIVKTAASIKDFFNNQINSWYNLCGSILDCLRLDEMSSELVENFIFICFQFDASSWRAFEKFLTDRLNSDNNSLVRFNCVLSAIKVLKEAANHILVELNFDEVEMISGVDVRIEVLHLLLKLVIKTGCASKRLESRELLSFVQAYLDKAEIVEELENAAFLLICNMIPSDMFEEESQIEHFEHQLMIPDLVSLNFLTRNAQSVDQFLYYKVAFSYFLSHSRLLDENFPDLLHRIQKSPEDVDTLTSLSSNLSASLGTIHLSKIDNVKKICSVLIPNFRSYKSNVVLKTIEIFIILNSQQNENCDDECVQHVFRKFYQIMNIPDSFQDLREKLNLCEKVSFQRITRLKFSDNSIINREDLVNITISFLFSICFSRFVPLQKGVVEILLTFKEGKLERSIMAHIVSVLLKEAFLGENVSNEIVWDLQLMGPPRNNYDRLRGVIYEAVTGSETVSLWKKRMKLLEIFKIDCYFASIALSSFKDCFYEFLLHDFDNTEMVSYLKVASFLSELGLKPKGTCGSIVLGENESNVHLFQAFLSVFTSLPKTALKNDSTTLNILYLFLRSSLVFIQKQALECVLSFPQPDIQPYNEYLQLLTNEKCVKKALVILKFSNENSIVNENHREGVLKLLFPFLQGRLFNIKWLGNIQERFRAVCGFLRFLGAAHREQFLNELFRDFENLFICSDEKLFAFQRFDHTTKGRLILTFEQILSNLSNVLSFNIVKRCARCILSISLSLSSLKNQRRLQFNSQDRRLLKQCNRCLFQYLKTSPEPMGYVEMQAILEEIVKPVLVFKVEDFRDFKSASVPLSLKFVQFLAENKAYRKYLDYQIDTRNKNSVLQCLCSVYLSTKAIKEHSFFTLGVLLCLASADEEQNDDSDEDNEEDMNDVGEEGMDTTESPISGEQLLKKCSGVIVSFLQDNMLSGTFKSLPHVVKKRILKLLIVLIDELKEPQECHAMANTLSAFIAKRTNRERLEMETMTDITNLLLQLMRKIENPFAILLRLSSCFSQHLPHAVRMNLCQVFSIISESFASLLIGLNSWNQKVMDEPDFQLRFHSFAKVDSMLQEMEPKQCVVAVAALFINCCFFIDSVEDFGLRIKSVECIKMLMNNFLMTKSLVQMMKTQVSRLLKGKVEDANLTNIVNILACLVRHGHEYDKGLSELNEISVKYPEFINELGQLQIQKRCKSILKSVKLIDSGTFSWKTISFLFLPLAWTVLYSFEDKKDPNLINASIELLKSCAYKMSIKDLIIYSEKCLHFFNAKNESPKVPCRMFTAVLSAFGTNQAVTDWKILPSENQDAKTQSSLNLLAKKITSTLMGQKVFGRDHIDPNESAAIIAKIPLHIGAINVAEILPPNLQHFHTNRVLLSLCGLLRSRDKSVRHATRGVLMEIVLRLDKHYINLLIQNLFQLLDKGFMRKVLVFTLFRLLSEAKKVFKAGDIDTENMQRVAELLCRDTFEAEAEERSSARLAVKTSESSKTYAIPAYSLLGFYATNENLSLLLKPLDQVMESHCSSRAKNIVMQILNDFVAEVLENKVLEDLEILNFCEDVCSGNVSKILSKIAQEKSSSHKRDPRLQPIDCVLFEPVPTRVVDRKPIVQTFLYHHVFLHFGLQLLTKFISKVDIKSLKQPESLEVLQKLVPPVQQGLSSSYLPVVIQSVRCLKEFTCLPLKNVVTSENFEQVNQISEKYCRGNAVSKDLLELIPVLATCTKIFLAEKTFEVTPKQLSLVLAHVEEDLVDTSKVKSCLAILRPIIERKLKHENISGVMSTIANLMIQSEFAPHRVNCRNLYVDYLTRFVEKREKIEKCLSFFIAQMSSYKEQTGRESALELLLLFVSKAESFYLSQIAMKLFYPFCLVLANDSAETCCKLASLCLTNLIASVNDEIYQSMFQISFSWMKNNQEFSLIKLGCLVCELLLENASVRSADPKLKNILSLTLESIELCSLKQKENQIVINVRQLDYTFCAIFKLINKIVPQIEMNGNFQQFADLVPDLFQKVSEYLTYPHEWVQVLCCQIWAKVFSAIPANDFLDSKFVCRVTSRTSVTEFFLNVIKNLFANISHVEASEELRESSLKNIVYMNLASLSESHRKKSKDLILCNTILDQLKELSSQETSFNSTSFVKRSFMLKWANYVLQSQEFVECLKLNCELLDKVLVPLVKEVTSKASNDRPKEYVENLQKLFEKFEKAMKSDGDVFLGRYSQIIQELHEKRLEKKSAKRMKALAQPEEYTQMKRKRNASSGARMKRKMAEKKNFHTLKTEKFGAKRAKTDDEVFFERL